MMAKSFDLLIEFLLDEIAICGEHGESTSISSFCQQTMSLFSRRWKYYEFNDFRAWTPGFSFGDADMTSSNPRYDWLHAAAHLFLYWARLTESLSRNNYL
jgi:hypothetical protein